MAMRAGTSSYFLSMQLIALPWLDFLALGRQRTKSRIIIVFPTISSNAEKCFGTRACERQANSVNASLNTLVSKQLVGTQTDYLLRPPQRTNLPEQLAFQSNCEVRFQLNRLRFQGQDGHLIAATPFLANVLVAKLKWARQRR
jgi:hypothetical protein